jgi:hypothetical protein
MTLTELQNEVYAITNRPDMATQTLSAVRAATLSLHQADYYFKDLYETGVSFLTETYLQQWEYALLLPRFRALKYIRKTDAQGADNGEFFDVVPPELVTDAYQINRSNVVYVAGSTIQLRSSTPIQYVILGCYLNPDITVSGYNSWIAREHPFAIITLAAARIFKQIGRDTEYAAWTSEAAQEVARLKLSNILAVGY